MTDVLLWLMAGALLAMLTWPATRGGTKVTRSPGGGIGV